jgi:hypothetical protein
MSKYLELKADFEQKVKDLQAKCPHSELTEWHFVNPDWHTMAEFKTQQCTYCGKTVNWMRPCLFCKKEIFSKTGYDDWDHFFKGRWFCNNTCHIEWTKKEKRLFERNKEELGKAMKENRMPNIIVDE